MPVEKTNWDEVVSKLIRMTENGQLRWSVDPRLNGLREGVVGRAYAASFHERVIAIYEIRYKSYRDEDTWDWDTGVVVEFIDNDANSEWQLPSSPKFWKLLDVVKFQVAGVDKLLKELLAESS